MCKEHQKEAIKTSCPKLVQESQYRRCFSIRFFRGSSIKTAISNRPWPTLIMRHVDVHLGSVGHASQLPTKNMQDAKIKNALLWHIAVMTNVM